MNPRNRPAQPRQSVCELLLGVYLGLQATPLASLALLVIALGSHFLGGQVLRLPPDPGFVSPLGLVLLQVGLFLMAWLRFTVGNHYFLHAEYCRAEEPRIATALERIAGTRSERTLNTDLSVFILLATVFVAWSTNLTDTVVFITCFAVLLSLDEPWLVWRRLRSRRGVPGNKRNDSSSPQNRDSQTSIELWAWNNAIALVATLALLLLFRFDAVSFPAFAFFSLVVCAINSGVDLFAAPLLRLIWSRA